MKKKIIRTISIVILLLSITACSQTTTDSKNNTVDTSSNESAISSTVENETNNISDVTIQFGGDGPTYMIKMEDNDTARELVRNIGDTGRNLPIYDYDNFEGYEYFQYYDIPTTYSIPSNPETITSAKAGEVYYSAPNRVILFYRDYNISGEYTKVGSIEDTTGLKTAIEENPALEGWGNKLILLSYAN